METFLKTHWAAIAATDFFSVEVLARKGLVRYFVLFFIDLKMRRVEIAGIVQQPDGQWMQQIARNVVDIDYGFLNGCGCLIHDRDPIFTETFRALLASTGVTCLKLPARSPNLNAYAERFVRSIKYECLDRIIPLGERHLRTVVVDYTKHYHFERNHQGLDNRQIEKPRTVPKMEHPIHCKEKVGGILNYY